MGGSSSERDISVRSGLAIYQALQELGYNSLLIDAGKDIVKTLKKEKVKLAFLALHGCMGENGAIQGMLEVLGISYTGSGVLASAIAMDKEASKKIFSYHELRVAPFMIFRRIKNSRKQPLECNHSQIPQFELPWVVKPVSEGSSIGVSIVKQQAELSRAVEKTFSFGKKVLIEQFIEGKEIHIGILGGRVLGGVEVKPTLEFYNYEAKYTSGLTEYIIPPRIDETVYERIKDAALQSYTALGCSGACRVDIRIDEKGRPYILEVNTLPGMTTTSLLPKIAQTSGLSFKELTEEIIRVAIKET